MRIQLPFFKKVTTILALLFSLFAFNLNAQDCVTFSSTSTATKTFTDGSTVTPSFVSMAAFGSFESCSTTASGLYSGTDGAGSVTMTFSAPYTGDIEVTSSAQNIAENFNVLDNTNSVAAPPTLVSGCLAISGNSVIGTRDGGNGSGGVANFAVVNTTSITLTFAGGQNGSIIGLRACRSLCGAGTTAPPLSATTLTNVCATTTADLDALHTGTIPGSTTLVWSTDNDSSDGLASTVATPTTVAVAGTYYAYYFDATNTCYSPVSASVAFTVTNCCKAGTEAPKY